MKDNEIQTVILKWNCMRINFVEMNRNLWSCEEQQQVYAWIMLASLPSVKSVVSNKALRDAYRKSVWTEVP